ncbi:MAG: hypothetical protein ABR591_06385 [Candidatus Velthaea sp.]
MTAFAPALAVANAVLYEGYLLFPYTASSAKNRVRWQFGVVVPQAYLAAQTGETAEQQTEVLVEAAAQKAPRVTALLRFLHVEARQVEALDGDGYTSVPSLVVKGTTHLTFDEAVEREIAIDAPADATRTIPIDIPGGTDEELLCDGGGIVRGRVVRRRWPLRGTVTIACERVPKSAALRKVRVHVQNTSDVVAGERAGALRTAFVSTHALLRVEGGAFVSLLDPPPEAAPASAALRNRHVFPVLIGDAARDERHAELVLASPIILYDFPAVAPQSEADSFDATEIDEMLALSVLSLPDDVREEARATDPRARAIVERAERYGPQAFENIHAGALQPVDASADPFAALDVPALDCVFVNGAKVAKGSAVRLHPKRRADVWDMFLDGKAATVRAIHQDVEDVMYVAVTVDDDPASDLHEWYGRSFFFYPDEIEPLAAAR